MSETPYMPGPTWVPATGPTRPMGTAAAIQADEGGELVAEGLDPRSDRVQHRGALDGALADQLQESSPRLGGRAQLVGRAHGAVLDEQDGLDGQQGAHQGGGAADASALLEVLQGVHGEVEVRAVRQVAGTGSDIDQAGAAPGERCGLGRDHAQGVGRSPRVDDLHAARLQGPGTLDGR